MTDVSRETVAPDQEPTCDAESCGYRCDKAPGHGDIHRDPHGEIWVRHPHRFDEWSDPGHHPWTGYQLLTERELP